MSSTAIDQQIPRVYSPREAAECLGVHINTIRRWIDNGLIGAFRIGGVVRIPAHEIDRITSSAAA